MEENSYKAKMLDAYLLSRTDHVRLSSQDICDNLRDMVSLTPDEVTEYLTERGCKVEYDEERMVWIL